MRLEDPITIGNALVLFVVFSLTLMACVQWRSDGKF